MIRNVFLALAATFALGAMTLTAAPAQAIEVAICRGDTDCAACRKLHPNCQDAGGSWGSKMSPNGPPKKVVTPQAR